MDLSQLPAPTPAPGIASLQWFQLVYFAIATQFIGYIFLRHGRPGAPGWFFLLNFCILRTVGDIIVKVAKDADTYRIGTIITNASLSALFFGFFGVWHEATYSVPYKHPFLYGWTMQIILHLIPATAIGLVLGGAVTATSLTATASNQKTGNDLVIVGVVIFFLLWLAICWLVMRLYWTPDKLPLEKKLTLTIIIGTPLLGLRTLYSMLGAFINNSSWSFLTGGTLAELVILSALPEFLIFVAFIAGGMMTRHLPRERRRVVQDSIPLQQQRRSQPTVK